LDSTETYDPATDSWNGGPTLPNGRSLFGTAALGDTIYLLGGSSGAESAVSDVDALDTRTASGARSPRYRPRWRGRRRSSWVARSTLGGTNGTGPVSTVYAYTATTNAWREVAPLPTARHGLAAVVFNGKIYALGGTVDGAPSKGRRDLRPGERGLDGRHPDARADEQLRGGGLQWRIHAMSQGVHQVFDPRANKWVTESPMPTVRQGQGSPAWRHDLRDRRAWRGTARHRRPGRGVSAGRGGRAGQFSGHRRQSRRRDRRGRRAHPDLHPDGSDAAGRSPPPDTG
jgi:hypothetical protein